MSWLDALAYTGAFGAFGFTIDYTWRTRHLRRIPEAKHLITFTASLGALLVTLAAPVSAARDVVLHVVGVAVLFGIFWRWWWLRRDWLAQKWARMRERV